MNKRSINQNICVTDSVIQANLECLLLRICEISNIAISQIRGDVHKREITDVRQAFAYMAKCTYPELRDGEIASLLNVDRTTVLYYLKQINIVKEKKNIYLKLREEILNDEN